MRSLLPLIVCCLLINFSTAAQNDGPAEFAGSALCKTSGVVEASTGGIFPHLSLVFAGPGFNKEVSTDEKGKYEVSVPAGVYEVKSVRNGNAAVPYRRSIFEAKCGEGRTLDIVILPWCVSGCSSPGVHYSTFGKGSLPGKAFEAVIGYAEKKRSDGAISYYGAALSYGYYTVTAEQIIQSTKTGSIEARGSVAVRDGIRVRTFDRVRIVLDRTGLHTKEL